MSVYIAHKRALTGVAPAIGLGLFLAGFSSGCAPSQPQGSIGAVSGRILGSGATVTTSPEIAAERVATRDDVVSVSQFWGASPWLYDPERGPVGFKVPVYFVSAETQRGVFVSGTVICKLFVVSRAPDGAPQRELAWTWRLNAAEAMKFRVRKLTIMGHPYNFYLTWPAELKLYGRDIEIQFFYERVDGRVINGAPRRFKLA